MRHWRGKDFDFLTFDPGAVSQTGLVKHIDSVKRHASHEASCIILFKPTEAFVRIQSYLVSYCFPMVMSSIENAETNNASWLIPYINRANQA